jgi:hypothetical protein
MNKNIPNLVWNEEQVQWNCKKETNVHPTMDVHYNDENCCTVMDNVLAMLNAATVQLYGSSGTPIAKKRKVAG